MKQAFLNSFVIAKKMYEVASSYMNDNMPAEDYNGFFRAVKSLVGDDVYKEAFDMSRQMMAGKDVFRSSKPRVFEAIFHDDGTTYRKMFDSIEKAEKYLAPYRDVEIHEHFIE